LDVSDDPLMRFLNISKIKAVGFERMLSA